jgi:hypothetical protein
MEKANFSEEGDSTLAGCRVMKSAEPNVMYAAVPMPILQGKSMRIL